MSSGGGEPAVGRGGGDAAGGPARACGCRAAEALFLGGTGVNRAADCAGMVGGLCWIAADFVSVSVGVGGCVRLCGASSERLPLGRGLNNSCLGLLRRDVIVEMS